MKSTSHAGHKGGHTTHTVPEKSTSHAGHKGGHTTHTVPVKSTSHAGHKGGGTYNSHSACEVNKSCWSQGGDIQLAQCL